MMNNSGFQISSLENLIRALNTIVDRDEFFLEQKDFGFESEMYRIKGI